jgi:hypothetical protein
MSDSEYDISSGDDAGTQFPMAETCCNPATQAPTVQPTPAKPTKPAKQPAKPATQAVAQSVGGRIGEPIGSVSPVALQESTEKVKKARKSRAKNSPNSDFQQVKIRDEATLENTKLILSLVERIEFLDKKLDSATNGVQAKRAAEIQSNLHQAKAMFAKFSR